MSFIQTRKVLGNAGQRALDFLFPLKCEVCGQQTQGTTKLCPKCWGELQFIVSPYCVQCGLPFAVEDPGAADLRCATCLGSPPAFDQARSVWVYNAPSRRLILKLKHADCLDLVSLFAQYMCSLLRPWAQQSPLVLVPVPLHWTRLLRRHYNQSVELARAMGHLAGNFVGSEDVIIDPHLLKRCRATPPQGHLSRSARQDNVAKAIKVNPKRVAYLHERIPIVIDDVMTTGATLNECARILKKAGCKRVYALTLARVL